MFHFCRRILICLALLMAGNAGAALPMVATEPAQFVDAYRVQLAGTVTPQGSNATVWFEYGTTAKYGLKTASSVQSDMVTLKVPVENLKEQTTYHCRCVARSVSGTAYGDPVTFTTTAAVPVGIDVQPAAPYVLTSVGQTGVTMAITGHGSSAKYQWMHNNVAIPLAIYESYKLPRITTAMAGIYTCRVSNPKSSLVSDPVVIAVATISPSATITVNQDGAFSLTASITPANPAATFAWFTASNPTLAGIGTVPSANLAKLSVTQATAVAQDSYRCEIVSNGETLTVGPLFVAVRLRPVILPISPRIYEVGQNVNLPVFVFNSPTSVTVRGLPPGLVYNSTLRAVTGRPTVSSLSGWTPVVTARNLAGIGQSMSFSMNVDAIDAGVKTTFNGLVERSASPPGNNQYGGALTSLIISPLGTFTGKLVLPGTVLPANGKSIPPVTVFSFTSRLETAPSSDPSAVVTLKRNPPQKNLTFSFTIERAGSHLTGFLGEEGSAATARVEAWGNPYTKDFRSTGLAALHNFWMDPPGGVIPGTAPEGAGIGTATVNTLGAVALSLRLADGAAFTSSTTLSLEGRVPVHSMLYAGHGSIHGGVVITDQPNPGFNTVTGSLSWNKTAAGSASDHSYVPNGFDLGVADSGKSLVAMGGEQRVQPGLILWGLPEVLPPQNNVRLTFAGGGIAGAALASHANEMFCLTKAYRTTPRSPNLTGETLTVNGTTGAFNGTFSLFDGMPSVHRKVTFQGLIVPGLSKGRGWFTLVQIPVAPLTQANSPVQSGAVDLGAP